VPVPASNDEQVHVLEVAHDMHAQTLEALLAVIGRNGGDDAFDVRFDVVPIHARGFGVHAKLSGGADVMRALGGGDERLGRHAADIEAIAAHVAGFEQNDGKAELGCAGGDGKPC
jgi:hypothetical protein